MTGDRGQPGPAPAKPDQAGRIRPLLGRAIAAVVALLALSLSALVAGNWWITGMANPRIVTVDEAISRHTGHADVVIVLGARVYSDASVSISLEDRLFAALRLYRAGVAKKILLSGDHRRQRYDEVNAMLRWMLKRGVPKEALYLDHAGFRTLDTLLRAARVFNVRRAFIATQRFHLGRALFLADYAGIEALGVIADQRVYSTARFDQFREWLARTRAVLDRYVLRLGPTIEGGVIPIQGPASATHDRYSKAILEETQRLKTRRPASVH